MSDQNDSGAATPETAAGEGAETNSNESSNDLGAVMEKLEQFGNDIASLKRTAKKVTKEPKAETPEKTETGNSDALSEKVEALSMQVAGITESDEVAKAQELQAETGLPMDKLLKSNYFKSELADLRDAKANATASTGIKGDKNSGANVKQSAEYWIAKGESPTREQVPDRAVRAEIRKAFVAKEKGSAGGNFYNS
jgi:hypothetical protein